ncbi:hypothetical protein H0H87_006803 [Tephrocybe sp. NHM501043]|nr:hypothetical protein H0H87_006803 [Tephrocybe sp. NHM501043]
MKLNEDERKRLNNLHGMPANQRDASGSISSAVWQKKPTQIQTPTNNRPLRSERQGFGLYNKQSLANKSRTFNKTAKATLTSSSPPHLFQPLPKRRKVEERNSTATPRHQEASSINHEVIDLEDDDEQDLGVPVARFAVHQSTPDQINFLGVLPSAKAAGKRRASSPLYVEVDEDDEPPPSVSALGKRTMEAPRFRPNHDFDDVTEFAASSSKLHGSRAIKDGDATRALEADLDSDPIESFATSPTTRAQGIGNVKNLVQAYESHSSSKPRAIDLKVEAKKSRQEKKKKESIKGSMKDKKGTNPLKAFSTDPLMTPTPFKGSLRHAKKLWIDKWFYGTQLRQATESYFAWEDDNSTMSFFEMGEKVLWFTLVEDLSKVQIPEDPPFVLKMETKTPRTPGIKSRNHSHFKMGNSRFEGAVVIWVNTTKGDGKKNYDSFVQWLRKHGQVCEITRGPAGHQVWTMADGAAQLVTQALSRQTSQMPMTTNKESLKRPVPTEVDDDLALPPVDQIEHEISSHSISSVSSRPPRMMPTRDNPEAVRRSSRRKRSPSLDPEEVILSYPQGMPGAVYIKNSDYRRLDPGEYLNDTLIEFGLNADQGYESVRKWTSKINIFSKKYIIVPINENLHWYLVIIYQPEHVLTPPLSPVVSSPTTRGRKKAADAVEEVANTKEDVRLKSVFAAKPSPTPPPTADNIFSSKPPSAVSTSATTPPSPTPSTVSATPNLANTVQPNEAEEERRVSDDLLDFDPSCTVDVVSVDSNTTSRATSVTQGDPYDSKMDDATPVSDSPLTPTEGAESAMDVEDRGLSPTVSDYAIASIDIPVVQDVEMVDDSQETSSREDKVISSHGNQRHDLESDSIPPIRFYGKSNKATGKQKAIPNQAAQQKDNHAAPVLDRPVDVHDDNAEDDPSGVGRSTTFIFTLDSLGSRHPQAIKVLGRYLKKEAQDKLKKEDTSNSVGRQAQVPVQPNFCDCGLYLLHFAQTFISDPIRYFHAIMTQTKGTTNATRVEVWKGDLTGDMRERLRGDILELSAKWKSWKEEAKRKEATEGPSIEVLEPSDDDIDIVETTPPPVKATKKGGNRKTPKSEAVLRIR